MLSGKNIEYQAVSSGKQFFPDCTSSNCLTDFCRTKYEFATRHLAYKSIQLDLFDKCIF